MLPTRFLSVAPRYRPGSYGARGGHWTIYQDDLRGAAARLGIEPVILAGASVQSTTGARGILDTTDEWTIAASLDSTVMPGDVVVVYEGSTAMVRAFIQLAQRNPRARFLVNLFRAEPRLIPADRTRRRSATGSEPSHVGPEPLPANLRISADTELRADLARRIGIPCVGAWRLHTTLWEEGIRRDPRTHRPVDDALRLLVPLGERGYSEEVVEDVAYVLHRLRRDGDPTVQLTITGASSPRFSAQVRGPRLEMLGARRVDAPSSRNRYADLFREHDLVWIPNLTLYRAQSSGRVLDALASGRPVLAPQGTWPAAESSRWTGGELSYGDRRDLLAVLRALRLRVENLHRRLASSSERIRAAYSPDATLLRILELTDAEGGTQQVSDRSVPLRSIAPLPSIHGPLFESGARRSGVPTPAHLAAQSAARRVAAIGSMKLLEQSLWRLLGRVRQRSKRAARAVSDR